MAADSLLALKDLRIWFNVNNSVLKVINGVDLTAEKKDILGIVGESGSGKTVLANAMLGYVRKPGRIISGEIRFRGEDLITLTQDQLTKRIRGKEIGLIATNAKANLNPLLRVGDLISDVYITHRGGSRKQARERASDILRDVGINDAEERARSYPHELSGGMAQRISIALALVTSPALIIADDPTNGLDVTIAAQIMDLLSEKISGLSSSAVVITNDLGLVAQFCSRIAIIYSGQIVEDCRVADFFREAMHPYSCRLLKSLPEVRSKRPDLGPTQTQSDILPNPASLPGGCLYHPRCAYAKSNCQDIEPSMTMAADHHFVKCYYPIGRS